MQKVWNIHQKNIDKERFELVSSLLAIQEKEAKWWRDACLLYFQSFSGMPIRENFEKPEKTLEEYQKLIFHNVPGI
jgi:alpha-glucuronidase